MRQPLLSARGRIDGPSVLVVDDNPGTLDTIGMLLRHVLHLEVHQAATGAAAIEILQRTSPRLALIDWRLPDMNGLDMVKVLLGKRIMVPWILMSGFLDVEAAFEAGRLGALRVVHAPFDVEDIVREALEGVESGRFWPHLPMGDRLSSPKTSAERWASLVLKACEAEHDLPTLEDWRAYVGVSYSALTETSRLLGIHPQSARDFMRMLRALLRTDGHLAELEAQLDLGDYRTRDRLFERAGLPRERKGGRLSLIEYLLAQTFVSPNHPALMSIGRLLEGS